MHGGNDSDGFPTGALATTPFPSVLIPPPPRTAVPVAVIHPNQAPAQAPYCGFVEPPKPGRPTPLVYSNSSGSNLSTNADPFAGSLQWISWQQPPRCKIQDHREHREVKRATVRCCFQLWPMNPRWWDGLRVMSKVIGTEISIFARRRRRPSDVIRWTDDGWGLTHPTGHRFAPEGLHPAPPSDARECVWDRPFAPRPVWRSTTIHYRRSPPSSPAVLISRPPKTPPGTLRIRPPGFGSVSNPCGDLWHMSSIPQSARIFKMWNNFAGCTSDSGRCQTPKIRRCSRLENQVAAEHNVTKPKISGDRRSRGTCLQRTNGGCIGNRQPGGGGGGIPPLPGPTETRVRACFLGPARPGILPWG